MEDHKTASVEQYDWILMRKMDFSSYLQLWFLKLLFFSLELFLPLVLQKEELFEEHSSPSVHACIFEKRDGISPAHCSGMISIFR